ncbi:MAG: phage major capsid protein [Clostridia bacterium]|nr:phage major capsid protein [Clostridia bacterium]
MSYLKDELTGFVPAEQAKEILAGIVRGSSVLRLSKVEAMNSDKKKFNVLVDGPGAYWVGEGQRIETSGASWIHPEIEAKKLAVIIPVTKEKLNDSTINVFEELKPQIQEVFYKAIDKACLFGENSPFATNVMAAAEGSGMVIKSNSDIDLAISDTMEAVEANGYEVTGFAGHIGVKNALRKLRDANDAPVYIEGINEKELYSQPIEFVRNGSWDKNKADIIGGDWKYSIVGMCSGIEFEVLTEATLQGTLDADGKPLSLAEQDMIAIKATMRIGYLVIKEDAFAAYKYAAPEIRPLNVTSVEGTEEGTTVITVTPDASMGNSLVYKVAASATEVAYDEDLSAWDVFDGSEISATEGQYITVAETDIDGLAKKAGSCVIVCK